MHEVLTLKNAAVFLRCSPGTVRRRIRAGKLRASKVGRQWQFSSADLEASLSRDHPRDLTDLILSSPELVADIEAAEREAREGKFLSWHDVFGE